MSTKQILEIKQSLVMTSTMQESLKILQLPIVELLPYIESCIESNPLLEICENSAEDENSMIEELESDSQNEDSDEDENIEYSELLNEDYYDNSCKSNDFSDFSEDFVDNNTNSLRDYISNQISEHFTNPKEKFIALILNDMLDDNGYIQIEEIKLTDFLKCTKDEIENILCELQNFEPFGIFARSLQECLEIQIKKLGIYDDIFKTILLNLDLLAEGNLKKLAKICATEINILQIYIKKIRKLNPKPGSVFDRSPVQRHIPDLILKKTDGIFSLEINDKITPEITLNRQYYENLKRNTKEKVQKEYIKNCYNQAKNLITAVADRNKTLYQVAALIIAKQKMFFEKGIRHLNAMSLKEIANELSLNISTISRVVNKKYLATPMGTFQLKYFFTSKAPNSFDDLTSNLQVKLLIKKIIENENNNFYSDIEIVELLQKEAVCISRRTVTKYREQLKIPSSSARKRKSLISML